MPRPVAMSSHQADDFPSQSKGKFSLPKTWHLRLSQDHRLCFQFKREMAHFSCLLLLWGLKGFLLNGLTGNFAIWTKFQLLISFPVAQRLKLVISFIVTRYLFQWSSTITSCYRTLNKCTQIPITWKPKAVPFPTGQISCSTLWRKKFINTYLRWAIGCLMFFLPTNHVILTFLKTVLVDLINSSFFFLPILGFELSLLTC
jgi:hypothetical protein